ncbi:MAG: hypothetical protein KAT39_15505 [Alphaproteobacteria bacterium]|nr:hypothetical protein [Alphaproteobacteria bacterium]MCK5495672.1 hypothetical protein [Hyphomicrobiaceae bacterium]
MKSLAVQIAIAALVVAVMFYFWAGFTTTLAIGIAAGMVLANVSAPIEKFVEGLIAKARGG